MALGRPTPLLQLSREEREPLECLRRRPTSAQPCACGPAVVLACVQGKATRSCPANALEPTHVGSGGRFDGVAAGWPARRSAPGGIAQDRDEEVERLLLLTLENGCRMPPIGPRHPWRSAAT
jgi:hypothetical protein